MSEQFLERFLNDLVIWGSKSSNYEYFKELSQDPEFSWLEKLYNKKLELISLIDREDPNYLQQLNDRLKNIPVDDYSVVSYARKQFDLEWIKQFDLDISDDKTI